MSPWANSILAVAIVSALPLAVTFGMAARAEAVRRVLPYLTLFGAGALLGAAVLHLIPESLAAGRAPLTVFAGVAGGYFAFAVIERILARHDHAHAHGMALGAPSAHESATSAAECVHLQATPATASPAQTDPHLRHRRRIVPLALIGDALHNLVDGILIAAGFLTQPGFGLLTAVAIGLHELPREVGTFGVFLHGGIRPMKAVAYNLVTAVVSLIGVVLTLLIGARMASVSANILPVAAGTYLYIAQAVGIPALREPQKTAAKAGRFGWVAVGFVVMALSAAVGAN